MTKRNDLMCNDLVVGNVIYKTQKIVMTYIGQPLLVLQVNDYSLIVKGGSD